MPGKFYVENRAEKVSLQAIEYALIDIGDKLDAIKCQTDKLGGEIPGEGSTIADWQMAETDVIQIGAVGIRNKIHDLTLSIHNLIGSQITVRLYKVVNGTERKVYEQNFNAATDTPGLPIINGSWALHGILRVTLQSNDATDNGQAVDHDYMLEEMQ
jgi:hypothetical protein